MAKPWAKTEVGYMDHPKFAALSGNAIALWHEAKDYCSRYQTDGMIPKAALKGFRFSGNKSIALLTTSCGMKADQTPYAPLWEPHPVGFKMHDYLDHNDCREEALARLDDAKDAEKIRKIANKERQKKYRADRKLKIEEMERRLADEGPPAGFIERRSESDVVTDANVTRNVTRSCSTPTETETKTETTISTERDVRHVRDEHLDVAFLKFQAAYPSSRRKGGRMVEEAFMKAARRTEGGSAVLMAALDNHRASEQWTNPKHIPNMDKWIEEERWLQTLPPAGASTVGPSVLSAEDTRRKYLQ